MGVASGAIVVARFQIRALVDRDEDSGGRPCCRAAQLDGSEIVDLDRAARRPMLSLPFVDRFVRGMVDEVDRQFDGGIRAGWNRCQHAGETGE